MYILYSLSFTNSEIENWFECNCTTDKIVECKFLSIFYRRQCPILRNADWLITKKSTSWISKLLHYADCCSICHTLVDMSLQRKKNVNVNWQWRHRFQNFQHYGHVNNVTRWRFMMGVREQLTSLSEQNNKIYGINYKRSVSFLYKYWVCVLT